MSKTFIQTRSGGTIGASEIAYTEVRGGDFTGISSTENIRRFRGSGINPLYVGITQEFLPTTDENGATHETYVRDLVEETATITHLNNVRLLFSFERNVPGVFRYISGGDERILVEGDIIHQLQTAAISTDVSVTTNLGSKVFNVVIPGAVEEDVTTIQPAIGSFRKYVMDIMTQAALTQTVSDSTKARFSVQDHTNAIYTPNPDCWAKDFDFSCESPWNSFDGPHRSGTMVSPRHFIHANHYSIPNGTTIRFIATDGAVVDRIVSNTIQIGTTDIRLGVLDSDVPTTVSFAKILPDDYIVKMPGLGTTFSPYFPIFQLDQEEKIIAAGMVNINTNDVFTMGAPSALLQTWNEPIVVGDSGNPNLIPVNGEMILLYCFFSSTGGPGIKNFEADINTAMTALGGGYQLTPANLSSFNSY